MRTAPRLWHFSGMLVGLLLAAGQANAGFLGQTIRAEPQFGNQGDVCCGGPLDAVVGAGVEFPVNSFPAYNTNISIDLSDTVINYNLNAGVGYSPAAFNGFHFFDVDGTIDAIVGVSIDAATNLAGFDTSRVSFDADNVFINMQGLSDADGHSIILNVEFDGAVVPEPGSLALLGLGFGLLGFARRRARS